LRELQGRQEYDGLGALRVLELIVSQELEDVRNLIGGRREDGMVLRNVLVDVGFVLWYAVHEQMVFVQRVPRDLLDGR